MGTEDDKSGKVSGDGGDPSGGSKVLARVVHPPDTRARVCVRVISKALAEKFADELVSDVTHTVKSAALAVGINPNTARDAIHRYEHGKCGSLEDEEICEILVKAKEEHVKQLRTGGFGWAGMENRAGTSWVQWQLEVQDPLGHPRKMQTEVELSGPGGKPIETKNETKVQYVVTVPPDEPDDEDEEANG